MILDLVDLATFGPIGLFGGWILGAAVGWWVASIYGFSKQAKINIALLAAIYCMIPFTEPVPVATIVFALTRFFEKPPQKPPENDDDKPPRKWIDSKTMQ